jgi:tetratricopeptide (TPR) repeat protein
MAISARLDELKKKFDENPRRYFAPLANELRKQGDLAQAIALCRTHLPNQPGHISGNIVLAQALYESQALVEARRAFEAALELDPENLIALRYLGDIARQEGSPAAAHAWYQRVLEADPRNDEIAQLLREVEDESSAAAEPVGSSYAPPAVDAAAAVPVTPSAPSEPRVPILVPPAYHPEPVPSAQVPPPAAAPEQLAPPPLPVPPFEAVQVSEPPVEPVLEPVDESFFSKPEPAGELQAMADAGTDDWFGEPNRDQGRQAAPAGESLFPDLSEAARLPQPPEPALDEFTLDWEVSEQSTGWSEPAEEPQGTPDAPAQAEFTTPQDAAVEETPLESPSAPAEPAMSESVEPEARPFEWQASFSSDVGDAVYWDVEPATTRQPTPWDSLVVPDPQEPQDDARFQAPPDVSETLHADPLLGRTPDFTRTVEEEPPAPFVTETMAELYLQQGFNEEALAIYRQLLAQAPGDETLQRRVATLEQGGGSSVVDLQPRAAAEPGSAPSVRAFFARFATRSRRERASPGGAAPNASDAEDERGAGTFGGAATREEALTQPDEGPGTLTDVFSTRAVAPEDATAASTLASAFEDVPEAASDQGELSLGHLFRDVEAHSAGAVTAGEYAPDSHPAAPDEASSGDVESHADIEQFTAWLEGLKKK